MNIPNEEWLKPSNDEIDRKLKDIIKSEWSQPPTALQLAKALQLAIYFSLASEFVIKIWSLLYNEALLREGKSKDELLILVKEWFDKEYLNVP